MKKVIISSFLILFCFLTNLFAQQQMQDVVYLKDGSIIKGQIIEQVPNESIKIMTADGSTFVYNMEDVLKITREAYVASSSTIQGEKSPALAFILSCIIPGVGQYYNGDIFKGVIQEIMVFGGYFTAIAFGHTTEYHEGDGYYGFGYSETKITPLFWIGLGTAFTGQVWSIIDAPISASRINRQNSQQSFGHMIEYNNNKYTLGLDITPNNEGIGAMITIHF